MNTQDKKLTHGMILKGDKVLELGFDQIWIDGEFARNASEVEGIEELADIDMSFVEVIACDSSETRIVQKWISVSGDQRIMMTKKQLNLNRHHGGNVNKKFTQNKCDTR